MRKGITLSTKLVALTLIAIMVVLVVVMGISSASSRAELKRLANANQEMRIRMFWHLLAQKGDEFRIVDDRLLVGDYVINGNFELPDRLSEISGGTATVFMRDERVSTNVTNPDGSRAVGTKLQGAAHEAIFTRGEAFRGEADILGTRYFTAYDPIKDRQGETIGVLYTGIKRSEFFAQYEKSQRRVVGLSLVLAALVGLIAMLLLKMIVTGPLNRVVTSLRTIAAGEGDLTERLEIRNADEIGQLAAEFNKFIDRLEAMVTKIKHQTAVLDNSIYEVVGGSQALSQASQEQASAIEEIAAALEQMGASIKQNARNAEVGRDRTNATVQTAHAGRDASHELMQAMAEISRASEQIGGITVTVNEVAFQTNLLALNAAVEAARAGEHGRGFAVVAQEVRALAQRSAEAASQIKTLIETTAQKVRAGDAIASRSAESLALMIQQIEELSMGMDEIVCSSAEQETGVSEVNRAITQIDSSTQQNASTAEQLAGASDSIGAETQVLASVVAGFRVSGEVAADPRSAQIRNLDAAQDWTAGDRLLRKAV